MFVSSTYSVKVISSANAIRLFQIIPKNKNSDKSKCSRRVVVVLLALVLITVVNVFCPPRLVFVVVLLSSSESLPRTLEDVLVDKEEDKEDDDACRPLFALVFILAFESEEKTTTDKEEPSEDISVKRDLGNKSEGKYRHTLDALRNK